MTLDSRVMPGERLQALRDCINDKGFARILEAHSGLSGIIAERAQVTKNGTSLGFDGLWESSLTDSATKGYPDASIVGNDSRIHTVNEILNVTTKPLIVDGDTGGDPTQFAYLVKHLERLGVSAVIIEDKLYPKRNSLDASARQDLEDPMVFADKIRFGKALALTDAFMIVARLESLIAGRGLADALGRAEQYILAGVDGIMIHSNQQDPADILAFANAYGPLCERLGRRPVLVCVPTTYNSLTEAELIGHGFNIIIHANHLLRAAYQAMDQVACTLLESGRSLEVDPLCAPVADIFTCVGHDAIKRQDQERDAAFRRLRAEPGGVTAPNGQRQG